ncbi:hypothetical protein IGI37_002775 [Enterococcus sp. AZ194]
MKLFFISQVLLYLNLLLILLIIGFVFILPNEITGALSWFLIPLAIFLLGINLPISMISFAIFWKKLNKKME